MTKRLITALTILTAVLGFAPAANAKDSFKICWSIYVGWMPWDYGAQKKIVEKWADKYDISIDVVQINDYVESINQYTAGQYDGCSMTNMDALTIPAAGGVDTTALIVGDFSAFPDFTGEIDLEGRIWDAILLTNRGSGANCRSCLWDPIETKKLSPGHKEVVSGGGKRQKSCL